MHGRPGSLELSSIDTTPIRGRLADLGPVRVTAVDHTPWEPLWDQLMNRYHYLGHRKMLGTRMKQIAWSGERPLALAGWRAASLNLESRDRFIGWSQEQKGLYLPQVANNNRFLVLPWVEVPNLPSFILARFIEALRVEWPAKYGRPLLLLETFVDPRWFAGTLYRAANWIRVGQTRGFTKQGRAYRYHGHPKEVYVYPLEAGFRAIIGCHPKPPRKRHFTQLGEADAAMMLQRNDWSPTILEESGITQESVEELADLLVEFHRAFAHVFSRPVQRAYGLVYLKGLMSDLEAKSVEPIALRYLGPSHVRNLQRFVSDAPWDDAGMREAYQDRTDASIGEEDGVTTVDSSEFPKKGKESVGVGRQYCGRLGKVENCQSGVFVGYSSFKGYALLDSQLFVPKHWFSPEYADRRQKCGVPEELTFQTKAEIALQLLRRVRRSASGRVRFPGRWVACDSAFGKDRAFREALAAEDYWYLAQVPSDLKVFLEWPEVQVPPYRGQGRRPFKPRPSTPPRTVAEVAADPETHWDLITMGEGAKGPIVSQMTRLRVVESRDDLPQEELWLLIRRDPEGKTQYWLSNAPQETPFEEMVRVSLLRWPIEQCFHEGKGDLGMDHYELRSWQGWHRHMLYVFLAMLFLLQVRWRFTKKATQPPS